MQPLIEVKGLGKKYDIAHMRGGYVALRDVIANVFKNPFSFIASKARWAVGLEKKEEFWALKDVSFSVNKGEVVGVIGANGAGKSTLLKILSQITPPTEGEAVIRGRVGSLLEVGTGFHPELTGRENIFLNGAILGMKKHEIASKFDSIVAFAGVDRFLDTPVKHYSSGMYVRLAFSVAAHMEPDILLVDEVLAVGDSEFQKKCLGKMDEITRKDGRTIIFVSHNLKAVKDLCKRSILLDRGRVAFEGDTEQALAIYADLHTGSLRLNRGESSQSRRGSGSLSFTEIQILDREDKQRNIFKLGEKVRFKLSYQIFKQMTGLHANVCIFSSKSRDELLTDMRYEIKPGVAEAGESGSVIIETDLTVIRPGEYQLYFWIGDTDATTQGTPVNYDVVDRITKPLVIKPSVENSYTTGSFTLPSQITRE